MSLQFYLEFDPTLQMVELSFVGEELSIVGTDYGGDPIHQMRHVTADGAALPAPGVVVYLSQDQAHSLGYLLV